MEAMLVLATCTSCPIHGCVLGSGEVYDVGGLAVGPVDAPGTGIVMLARDRDAGELVADVEVIVCRGMISLASTAIGWFFSLIQGIYAFAQDCEGEVLRQLGRHCDPMHRLAEIDEDLAARVEADTESQAVLVVVSHSEGLHARIVHVGHRMPCQ